MYVACHATYYAMYRSYFKENLQLQRTEKFQTSKHSKISCKKMFHFPNKFQISSTKNSDDIFLVISSIVFQTFPTLQVQLHKPTFCIIHSQNVTNLTLFTILFYAFPLFQFKIYNCNCTILMLQPQTAFYNCTNCHQLHVKICPGYVGTAALLLFCCKL